MRLAWKVFLSTSLVMVVLVGIAAWSLRAVNKFVHVNATIIGRSVPALRLETSLRESMLSLLRLESRWAVLRDPGYAALWNERADRFVDDHGIQAVQREQPVVDGLLARRPADDALESRVEPVVGEQFATCLFHPR